MTPARSVVSVEIMGLDVWTSTTCVAAPKASGRAPNGARFEVADAVAFHTSERFDIIVLNEVLYYIDHPELALERYEGFLASDGVLIISMYRVPESLSAWRRCADRLKVLDNVWLRGSDGTEWNVWLCRPRQLPAAANE